MTITPTLNEMQGHGFSMGGEPLVSIDLVDTVARKTQPPFDMLAGEGSADAWWALESGRLPNAPTPDPIATRRLRDALREVFEALIDSRSATGSAIQDLNAFADSVPTSPRIEDTGNGMQVTTRWHHEHGGNAALAAIAREAIAFIGDEAESSKLRRCANETCSMLFVAENSRRIWCAANVCGNRARVARHYQRTHESSAG
jgi:predicted RNA-binding Zn ribbon-like protein